MGKSTMLNYLGLTGAMYGIHDVYSVCQAFIDRSSGSRTKSGARGVAGGETPRRRDHFFSGRTHAMQFDGLMEWNGDVLELFESTYGFFGCIRIYPLVMTDIAIENDHRNSGFSHEKW